MKNGNCFADSFLLLCTQALSSFPLLFLLVQRRLQFANVLVIVFHLLIEHIHFANRIFSRHAFRTVLFFHFYQSVLRRAFLRTFRLHELVKSCHRCVLLFVRLCQV